MKPEQINVCQIQALVQLSESGNLNTTANTLGILSPALSARMSKLNDVLGFHVQSRRGRGNRFTLSDEGQQLVEQARALLNAVNTFCKIAEKLGLQQREKSVLVAGGATAAGYLLPRLQTRYRQGRADTRIDIVNRATSELPNGVLNGEYDFAIVTEEVAFPGENSKKREGLEVVPWFTDQYFLVCAKSNSLSGNEDFEWADINRMGFLWLEGTGLPGLIEQEAHRDGFGKLTMSHLGVLPNVRAILETVRGGLGMSFVASSVWVTSPTHEHVEEGLCFLPHRGRPLMRNLVMIRRKGRAGAELADAFWDFLLRSKHLIEPLGELKGVSASTAKNARCADEDI